MTSSTPTELIVALDYPRADQALQLVEKLEGTGVLFKVGLELFMASHGGGSEFVRELVHRKTRVFLDLKLHDIPTTVARAARQAALLHVEMFTLHLSGGGAMVRAVADELKEITSIRPKILGVSVLTSFGEVGWAVVTKALTGHPASPESSVRGLVEHAASWGADGVVCSAHELSAVRELGSQLYAVVPGIRPAGFEANDQARVMTPAQARLAGASAIVVGRPITQASDPRAVVKQILAELGVT